MEISFSAEELRAVVGLNASVEEALDAAEDAEEFERVMLEDVSGWVLELREAKGDKDAGLYEPMLQDMASFDAIDARARGVRGADLRKVLLGAVVDAVTARVVDEHSEPVA